MFTHGIVNKQTNKPVALERFHTGNIVTLEKPVASLLDRISKVIYIDNLLWYILEPPGGDELG